MSFELITGASSALGSPMRTSPAERGHVVIGAVQCAWDPDPEAHARTLAEGVHLAAEHGAELVCLQELSLSPYFAVDERHAATAGNYREPIPGGPTTRLARRLAAETGAAVHASLYEDAESGIGFNTAICAAPDGQLLARTRKLHIPAFPGYLEHLCFAPGDTGFPLSEVAGARVGFPTCWDQWFPELARAYSLAGADLLVYPTAIGSEPHHPGFDSQPMWEHMITANGLANATFMVAINRIGTEHGTTFYGSSFISDPYGRVVVRAPRDRAAVIVADLDLDQRRDWLDFGLLATRRPDVYAALVHAPAEPVAGR
ncbi:MAG TPA: nitrilase-related carbon-nitrogen hydrolase [Solirubrobacteraceae bacterium]|nr:nitrilase-related carbon-nitrogen hydrolase [Solirubrobacteraceae bacterium]